jgi:hypothetical protein
MTETETLFCNQCDKQHDCLWAFNILNLSEGCIAPDNMYSFGTTEEIIDPIEEADRLACISVHGRQYYSIHRKVKTVNDVYRELHYEEEGGE